MSQVLVSGVAGLLVMVSCKPPVEQAGKPALVPDEGVLVRVGSVEVTQADLDYQLKEKHAGRSDDAARRQALHELSARARLTQAALDAGLDAEPVARAEIARILSSRLRETVVFPRLKAAAAEISEPRLREIYESRADRFQSPEKRQAAVLWLNPGADPERGRQYQAKMQQALEWYSTQSDLTKSPDLGFSVLAVDYSEHAASRFKNGVLGWFEAGGGADDFSRSVAEIVFSLKSPGDVSPVVVRPEGVFLVRCMSVQAAVLTPFENVRDSLEREEQARIRTRIETDFESELESKYPIEEP